MQAMYNDLKVFLSGSLDTGLFGSQDNKQN